MLNTFKKRLSLRKGKNKKIKQELVCVKQELVSVKQELVRDDVSIC